MKKELNYLSLPDYFNKFLLCNFNEKANSADFIKIQFNLDDSYHLGSAIKSLYLLETIFPSKPVIFKIRIKKKKSYFGQKTKHNIKYNFITSINLIEFIDFFRFFFKNPFNLKKNKNNNFFVTNNKLNQFNFSKNMITSSQNTYSSSNYFIFYHLN